MTLGIKTTIKTLICVFLVFSLAGCWDSREIDTLAIVMGIGIDKAKQQDEITVTTQIVNPEQIGTPGSNGGVTGGKKAYWNVHGTGKTMSEAMAEIIHQLSRKLFFPHDKIIVFGKEAAIEGIGEHIDFFMRNYEIRLNSLVLITECYASNLLDVEREIERIPAMSVADLEEIQEVTSQISVFRLYEFVLRLMSETTSPVAAYIETIETEDGKTFRLQGTAVFKEDKMVGTLTRDETRGFLWVIGEVIEGTSMIEYPDKEHPVTIAILNANSKIYLELKDDMPVFKIKIECDVGIENLPASVDLIHSDTLKDIEKAYEDEIRKKVLSALDRARELHTDIFGFGERVRKKYPKKWKLIKGRWDELFQKVEVEILPEANLRESGGINNNVMKGRE